MKYSKHFYPKYYNEYESYNNESYENCREMYRFPDINYCKSKISKKAYLALAVWAMIAIYLIIATIINFLPKASAAGSGLPEKVIFDVTKSITDEYGNPIVLVNPVFE